MKSELDSDGYEEIGYASWKPKSSRPTAMELMDMPLMVMFVQ